jgi:hypothetical protein
LSVFKFQAAIPEHIRVWCATRAWCETKGQARGSDEFSALTVSVTVLSDAAAVDDVMSWQERVRAAEGRAEAAEARVAELAEQVAVLSRILFGQSSEKSRPSPAPGGDAGQAGGVPGTAGSGVARPGRGARVVALRRWASNRVIILDFSRRDGLPPED